MLEAIRTRLHTHDTLSDHIQKTRNITISVPKRIKERWCKTHCNNLQFRLNKSLSEAKVSAKEFKRCWKMVQPTIPEDEIFCLFEKTFGSGNNRRGKIDFINYILRRYQNMGETVCDCVVFLSFVSMCCVGLLLYQCSISCVLIALTDWAMTDTAYLTGFVCLIRLRSTTNSPTRWRGERK